MAVPDMTAACKQYIREMLRGIREMLRGVNRTAYYQLSLVTGAELFRALAVKYPIHSFDLIIADECHLGYTSKQVAGDKRLSTSMLSRLAYRHACVAHHTVF